MNDAILNTINAGLEKAFATKPSKTLAELKDEMLEIQGQWDGDNAGIEEDRANIAQDILDAIKNVEELLEELEENEVYEQDNIK